ncbi:MAG: cellulose biosynthesis cyclic di-GMP-binding regulatory protein BcsB [Sulfurovum sp.]|nr:cellulose biosynthesis cyclic di-GMP-binding regulatory protein BcsB [Sulfurovum sp.]
MNYVINNTDDTVLKNYSLFTAVASTHLKYKIERIAVSSDISKTMHNIIIAPKKEARKVLKALDGYYLFDQKPSYALHFNSESCNKSTDNFSLKKDENSSSSYAHFNGGFIKIPKNSTVEKNTIAMWIRSDIQEGEKFLFGTKDYALMLSESSIGFSSATDNLFGTNIALEDNKWHYLVATFSKNGLNSNTLFVDGQELQLEQLRGLTTEVDTELETYFYIASRSNDDTQAFHGDINHLYHFNNLLTNSFAQKLYRTASLHRKKRMSGTLFIDEKISHDINIIQNPFHIENAIVVIAPKNADKIEQCITALYKTDLILYKQIGLDINKSTIPPPAQPYTAKRFLPLDQKIYFKELGYSTTLLKGQYPSKVVLDFKVYPDNFFDSSDQMKLSLHTVFPTVVRDDSVVNIYLNQKFAKQIDIVRSAEESESKIDIENLFDWDSLMDMPAYLVGQGYNRLSIDFSLIPKKENFCEVFNTENLVATLLDDSYLILPKAERWIELPYLQLIPNSSYPYSIYPDLQETTILLTNKSLSTIAASMNFIFYLTQQIDSYPYYLNITNKVNSKTKVSHIIAFGTVKDKLMQDLSQDAPLVINEDIAGRTYPFIEKFVAYKNILDEERTQKYSFRKSHLQITQKPTIKAKLKFQKAPNNFICCIIHYHKN